MITATRWSLNFTKTPQTSQRLVPSTNYLTSQYVDCPGDPYQGWATSFCLQSRLRSTCSIYLILCGWPNETQLLKPHKFSLSSSILFFNTSVLVTVVMPFLESMAFTCSQQIFSLLFFCLLLDLKSQDFSWSFDCSSYTGALFLSSVFFLLLDLKKSRLQLELRLFFLYRSSLPVFCLLSSAWPQKIKTSVGASTVLLIQELSSFLLSSFFCLV